MMFYIFIKNTYIPNNPQWQMCESEASIKDTTFGGYFIFYAATNLKYHKKNLYYCLSESLQVRLWTKVGL